MSQYFRVFICLALCSLESVGGTFQIREHHTVLDFDLAEIDDLIQTHHVEFKKNKETKERDFESDISLSANVTYTQFIMNGSDLISQTTAIEDLHALCQKCLCSETAKKEMIIPESSRSIYYAVSRIFPIQVDYYIKYNDTYRIEVLLTDSLYQIELNVTLNLLTPFCNMKDKGLLDHLSIGDRMSVHAQNIAYAGQM